VRLSATAVEVLDGPQVVARHERVAGKHAEILVLETAYAALSRYGSAYSHASSAR
jgi:hypothetical protein